MTDVAKQAAALTDEQYRQELISRMVGQQGNTRTTEVAGTIHSIREFIPRDDAGNPVAGRAPQSMVNFTTEDGIQTSRVVFNNVFPMSMPPFVPLKGIKANMVIAESSYEDQNGNMVDGVRVLSIQYDATALNNVAAMLTMAAAGKSPFQA